MMENLNTKSSATKLAVFDIDGTITSEGNDSWLETTYAMVTNRNEFESCLSVWKENKASDPYGASIKMMEEAISLFKQNTSSNCVFEAACGISFKVIDDKNVRDSALDAIKKHYDEGFQIVFATTSYKEAGLSLVKALKEKELLSEEICENIIVSGTDVDWKLRKIIHFNMSDGKLEGIAKTLGLPTQKVKTSIEYAYGDDPLGNDSGILKAASNGYVIHTNKNSTVELNNIGERVRW